MGASANVSHNQAESIVSAYTDMIMQQVASCSSTLAQNQGINVSNITTNHPIIINGIKMNQQSVMSPQCTSDLTTSQKTKTALANLQKQIAKAVSHATPLNVSGNASFNASTMVTKVLDSVSAKSVQDCINQQIQNQNIGVHNVKTTNTIHIFDVDLNQVGKSVSDCVFKSAQSQIGRIKAINDLQQKAKTSSKLFGPGLIAMVVVVGVVIVAGIVAYIIYRQQQKKREQQEQQLGQQLEERGVEPYELVEEPEPGTGQDEAEEGEGAEHGATKSGTSEGKTSTSGHPRPTRTVRMVPRRVESPRPIRPASRGGGGGGLDTDALMKAGMMAAASSTPEGAVLSALLR